jgi:hypothetical protein
MNRLVPTLLATLLSFLTLTSQAQTTIVSTLGATHVTSYTNFNQTALVGFRFTTDSQAYALSTITGALTRQAGPGTIAPELLL